MARGHLLEALYVGEVEELCRSAGELDDADPWEALNGWFERFIAYLGTKRALALRGGQPLLKRAQEAGVVRPDVSIGEVIQMVVDIGKIPTADPQQTERMIRIALDGLRYRP